YVKLYINEHPKCARTWEMHHVYNFCAVVAADLVEDLTSRGLYTSKMADDFAKDGGAGVSRI
ncbi:hypothetical protein BGZ73_000860, partial [Actinomortierella ambigua]